MTANLLPASEVSRGVAEIIRPPRRILPSTACEQLKTEKGPWVREQGPMFLEPLDELGQRRYQGICVVGPSRTSKTMTLVLGGVTYVVTSAPADTLIIHTSEAKAREFSRKDLDRAIRHSDALRERLSPRPRDDNVFDKYFRSGMALNIGWPSATQLASSTYKYAFITDYDRSESRDDVDGEGTLWDQTIVRVRTYMSRGKLLAESSPGGEYLRSEWKPQTAHEAPPATGILAIYNRGTRARWYWPCQHCGEFFQAKPGLESFSLPPFEQLEQDVLKYEPMWLAEQFARIGCPACGGAHQQEQKSYLNTVGRWVHEGESIDAAGQISGERRRTDIASYWQGGCSASFQSWTGLLLRYFQALQIYARTGEETTLKATTNTDQSAPYLPAAIRKRRGSDQLQQRAKEERSEKGVVPVGARFLTAAVDVQGNRFVVEFYAWGVGLERWVVDRFVISASRRPEGDRHAALDPASYVEDWEVLIDEVIERSYPIAERPDKRLQALIVLCDSGGKTGVTMRAYEFWRALKARNLGKRLMLVKGTGQLNAPRAQLTWPDARGRKDRDAGARGDVPVWLLNVNLLKDAISGDLAREQPGAGYVHLPAWLDADYFGELSAETRNTRGIWEKQAGARNEAFDLHVYNRAACTLIKAESIDWDRPPEWAAPFDQRRYLNPREAPPPKSARRVRSAGVR